MVRFIAAIILVLLFGCASPGLWRPQDDALKADKDKTDYSIGTKLEWKW